MWKHLAYNVSACVTCVTTRDWNLIQVLKSHSKRQSRLHSRNIVGYIRHREGVGAKSTGDPHIHSVYTRDKTRFSHLKKLKCFVKAYISHPDSLEPTSVL